MMHSFITNFSLVFALPWNGRHLHQTMLCFKLYIVLWQQIIGWYINTRDKIFHLFMLYTIIFIIIASTRRIVIGGIMPCLFCFKSLEKLTVERVVCYVYRNHIHNITQSVWQNVPNLSELWRFVKFRIWKIFKTKWLTCVVITYKVKEYRVHIHTMYFDRVFLNQTSVTISFNFIMNTKILSVKIRKYFILSKGIMVTTKTTNAGSNVSSINGIAKQSKLFY